MNMLTALDKNTIRLIGSTQVITSIFSVVKELIENSLDADATTVDVRLENYGLDKIEVRDNGNGISPQNIPYVAKRYHTSKIGSFNDIQKLETYGFRGEALGSLCTVSNLSVTTKTAEDEVSLSYAFNNQGQITSSHPSHLKQGTTVTATALFKNLPVRRQFYNTNKKKKDELKNVEDLLVAFSIILPKVRFTLTHNKEKTFQKNSVSDVRTALLGILGKHVLNSLVQKTVEIQNPTAHIDIFLPNSNSDVAVSSKHDNSRCICAVNRRPVHLKDFEKLIKQYYLASTRAESHRYPVYFLAVTMATDEIDVNIDPNKTTVFLHQKVEILKALTCVLEEVYGKIHKGDATKLGSVESDISKEDNSSFNESHIRDNSSDFSDSFSIQPVEDKQNDFPVIEICTKGNTDGFSTRINKDGSADSFGMLRAEDNNKLSGNVLKVDNNKTLPQSGSGIEDISLTQFGKPEFKIQEVSLDDLWSGDDEEVGNPSTVIDGDPGEKGNDRSKGSNIVYCSNPKLSEVFSDITSTWKESQSASEQGHGEILKSAVTCSQTVTSAATCSESINCASSCSDRSACARINIHESDSSSNGYEKHDKLDRTASILGNKSPTELSTNISTTNQCIDEDIMTRIAAASFGSNISVVSDGSNTNKTTAEGWSRGQSLTCDTTDIQPVTLLTGKRLLPLDSSEEPPAKRRSVIQDEGQRTLSDVLMSQSVRHPSSAFSQFCKDRRSYVVAGNPLADYDEVTRILETQWGALSDEEQEKYYKIKSPVKDKIRPTSSGSEKKERRLSCKVKQSKRRSSQTWTTIKEQLLKQKLSSAPQKVNDVQFNLQSLKDAYFRKIFSSQTQESSTMKLIGPLKSSGVWLGYQGDSLKIINPHRIQETILYHSLMANHVIDSEKMEPPIILSESYLGSSLWTTLKSLAYQHGAATGIYHVIQDRRLTANGIVITFFKDGVDFAAKVTGLTKNIPVYGIADVKEVLQFISETGALTLEETRPLKVLNYLQGEAVRMARQLPRQQSTDEMLDVLNQMKDVLPRRHETCLHNKPLFHTIYSFVDYPMSQSQSS